MGRVVVDERAAEAAMLDALMPHLHAIGREAKTYAQHLTPVLTGRARRSIFYVILDERGNVIGGDGTDDNGKAIANYFRALGSGSIRVIVGSNDVPYFVYIEFGSRGRPGRQIMARTAELIDNRARLLASEHPRKVA